MAQTERFIPGNNRAVHKIGKETHYILHATSIVTVLEDGRIILNSGGYRSATTKLAMNQVSNQFGLGFRVYQREGDWYVDFNQTEYHFHDAMELKTDHYFQRAA